MINFATIPPSRLTAFNNDNDDDTVNSEEFILDSPLGSPWAPSSPVESHRTFSNFQTTENAKNLKNQVMNNERQTDNVERQTDQRKQTET